MSGYSGELPAFPFPSDAEFERPTCVLHLILEPACSGSHDKTIIQWHIEDGACLRVFDDHTAPVMGILVTESGLLVSCAGDCKLKVWSLYDVSSTNGGFDDLPIRTTACDTLSGHNAIVEILTHIEPDVVFSGDTKGRIIRWSLETKSAETEYHGHKSGISCLAVAVIPSEGSWEDTPVLISGSSDATIRIWDIDNGGPLKELEVHKAGISCLKVYHTANYYCPLMFTGGSDNTIACCLLSPALDFPHLAR
jgi:WD40 repeat protein